MRLSINVSIKIFYKKLLKKTLDSNRIDVVSPKSDLTIFLLHPMAFLFFGHNLLTGLHLFFQHQSIYFQDWQNTIRIQRKLDTWLMIRLNEFRLLFHHRVDQIIYIFLYDQGRQDNQEQGVFLSILL